MMVDRREAGLKALAEMAGPNTAKQMDRTGRQEGFANHLVDMTISHVYGELWSRPGLDRRSRSLVTLGTLIALGREEELKSHFAIARNNGCTREEIEELLYHASAYAGFPAAHLARRAAASAFGESITEARVVD